jgi:molybdenum cofactor cytidylyltransferase
MGQQNIHSHEIMALVVAAGRSRRMGTSKLFLPWGSTTVIEKIITCLKEAGIQRVQVISGSTHERLKRVLEPYEVAVVRNPDSENTEMLDSIKIGIRVLPADIDAALITLGDQPQIQPNVIRDIVQCFNETGSTLIVPSFQMRRGHPWLINRIYWEEILALRPDESMRTFLSRHPQEIHYLSVDTSSILMDLDTPDDYQTSMPKSDLP